MSSSKKRRTTHPEVQRKKPLGVRVNLMPAPTIGKGRERWVHKQSDA